MNKQKLERGRGYALLLHQKRSRKPAFIAVKAANATRNKDAAHRFRAASFAGVLCCTAHSENRRQAGENE